jgi:hypothetical protein
MSISGTSEDKEPIYASVKVQGKTDRRSISIIFGATTLDSSASATLNVATDGTVSIDSIAGSPDILLEIFRFKVERDQ